MTHRTRIRANLAAWALNSALLPSEIDAFDAAQFAEIDGDAGGLWTPSSKIVLAGANGLEVRSPFKATGATGFNASMQAQNWPERPTIASTATINSDLPIAWDNPSGNYRYCALSFNTDSFTSEDGLNWVNRGSYGGTLGSAAADIAAGIVSGTPVFLATATGGGNVMKSINGGTTWAVIGSSGITRASIIYSAQAGLWVAAGDGGLVSTSPDGVTWTARTTPAGWIAGCGGVRKIFFDPTAPSTGRYIILPRGVYNKFLVGGGPTIWTEYTVTNGDWRGVAFSQFEALWMAVSVNGDVWNSVDGYTWTNVAPTGASGSAGLATYQSLWVAPTLNGFYGGIQWSADRGATWNRSAVGYQTGVNGWSRIIQADNRFVMSRANGSSLEFALSLRSS